MEYLQLIAGLLLLIVGGDYLVEGCVDIARRFKVSTFIIGMTIVAFGTSAPEFLVSLEAAVKGCAEISLGNVIGSNIANIGLILGLTALIYPLAINRISTRRDMPFLIVCSSALICVMMDNEIQRLGGAMLVAMLFLYIYVSIRTDRKSGVKDEIEEPKRNIWVALLITAASCVALAYGSDMLINGASTIARNLGISERVIGITIIAFGTSLPELAASMSAAFKKETDIAIGNIIGSNIFNILFVIGMSALIHPISNFSFVDFKGDLIWMMGITAALLLFMLPLKRMFGCARKENAPYSTLGRVSGLLLFAAYIAYIVLLITL